MSGHRAATPVLVLAVLVSAPGAIRAQSSTSYKLAEHAFNAGGRPAEAVVSNSASYRLSLESIGESIAGSVLTGASYRAHGGMLPPYPPAGEVETLQLLDDTETLAWSWDPASTAFNVYRGALSTMPGAYGVCVVSRVAGTSWADASMPAPGSGLFYLITGENRLWEEGTKGFTTAGVERGNPAPCP